MIIDPLLCRGKESFITFTRHTVERYKNENCEMLIFSRQSIEIKSHFLFFLFRVPTHVPSRFLSFVAASIKQHVINMYKKEF